MNDAQTLSMNAISMYEHAYQMDRGAVAVKYIDAFFAHIHTDALKRRLAQAFLLHRQWSV